MPDHPEPTPWGAMIRLAREAAGLSRPQAAARAGISKDNWANIELGYQKISATASRRAPGNADTVARMAYVVSITPDRLREAGRSDAAEVLAEIIRQRATGPRYSDPNLQAIDSLDLPEDERRALIALAEGMRQQRQGGAG